jgi:dihydroflavonol-4-reductase
VLEESAKFAEVDPAPYTLSKVNQEETAFTAGKELSLEVVAVCPTLVMGLHDYRLGPSNANIVNYLNDPFRSTFPGGCNVVSARDVAQAHLLAARHGRAGERYVAGSENLRWEAVHTMLSDLAGTFGPSLLLNHTATYLAAAWVEAAARLGGRRPMVTRDEARMACRFYWYSHARLAAFGYSPQPARKALAEGLAWVIQRGHISDAVVSRLNLASEVEEVAA